MTSTNPLTLNETQDIEQRALKVSNLIKKSAQIWLEVSNEVYDAKISLSKNSYSVFLTKVSLTTAIADKLLRIAKDTMLNSDLAKPYVNKFEGWSTLYEASKLNNDEKRSFFDKLNKDPDTIVSRALIQSFKSSTSLQTKSALSIAQIKVNEADLQRLDFDQYLDLKDKIDDISRIIDRMSPAITLLINQKNISHIENVILNTDQINTTDFEEYCDEPLPITVSASNNDSSISQVAF